MLVWLTSESFFPKHSWEGESVRKSDEKMAENKHGHCCAEHKRHAHLCSLSSRRPRCRRHDTTALMRFANLLIKNRRKMSSNFALKMIIIAWFKLYLVKQINIAEGQEEKRKKVDQDWTEPRESVESIGETELGEVRHKFVRISLDFSCERKRKVY